MKVSTSIEIAKSKPQVWQAITNIEQADKMISAIIAIKVLHQPKEGVVGLKWQETRKMFGKETTETMWITEAEDNQYYATRAESHGCIYITKLSLDEKDGQTKLIMSFSGESQSLIGKIMSKLMGFLMVSSMKKELEKDLAEIKSFVEAKSH